ncbi:MAG: CHASE2 domain-containing protein [Desulfotalea sp.]
MSSRLITPAVTLLLCVVLYLSGFLGVFSEISLKNIFRLRGEKPTSQQIVIVGVDEDSLAALGAWPFPRKTHADLLDHLKEAKVIAFDFLFNDPSTDDYYFSASIKKGPPVILATAIDYNLNITRPASTLSGFKNTGSINTILGPRGIVLETELSVELVQPLSLSQAMLAAVESSKIIPDSSKKLVNFYGPEFTFFFLSYIDVLQGKIPASFFKDRYVFIGAQAIGLGDVHLTPFSSEFPTPGVEIQATILNNLLDDSFLKTTVFPYVVGVLFLCFIFVFWHRLEENQIFWSNLVTVIVLFVLSYFCFLQNYFFDPSFPLTIIGLAYTVHLINQGLWMARQLIQRVKVLDDRLQQGLDELYENIPTTSIVLQQKHTGKNLLSTKGIRRHIEQLERGTKALAIQNHFINHLLKEEAPPIAIWENINNTLVIANTSFVTLWQFFHGKSSLPDFSLMLQFITEHSLFSEEVAFELEKLVTEQVPFATDICLTIKGQRKFYQLTLQQIDSAGAGFSGYIGNLTDVTVIHELERVKAEVLSIVSHELKLPLTVIIGYGEILADTLPEDQSMYAEEICTHAKRLNQMIIEFLDIERLESGKYVLRTYPFDLLTMLDDGISAVKQVADKKEITLQVTAPERVSPYIGDESLLLQVYINILDNAIKFSSSGTRVDVELVEYKRCMILNIFDQGPGISKEKQQTIFNKFMRGDLPEKEQGFGLGLSLVDQVVKSHGGSVMVSCRETGGAVFTIELPKNVNLK